MRTSINKKPRKKITDFSTSAVVQSCGNFVELAVHPTAEGEGAPAAELYLMCDDLDATVAELAAKDVHTVGERTETRGGVRVWFRLPSGARLGMYQPRHPVPWDR